MDKGLPATGREYLPHSSGCFLCGEENRSGVRARFFVEGDEVLGRVILPLHLNGYRDVAHGGVVSALLDETMGWAATVFGKTHPMYVTGELTVKLSVAVDAYSSSAKDKILAAGGSVAQD